MLAETAAEFVSWQQIATSLIVWAVCTILTGILVGAVAWGVTRKTLQVLQKEVSDLRRTSEEHEREFPKLREERLRCALSSLQNLQNYAHRGELSRLVNDSNQQYAAILKALAELRETFHSEIDGVHNRVTDVVEDVAALKATEKGRPV